MKANKISWYIIGALIAVSLIGSIVFTVFECGWWESFSFTILGSSIITFVTCILNYLCLAKNKAINIVESIYNINQKSYPQLYSAKENLTLGKIKNVIGMALGEARMAYWLTVEMSMDTVLYSCKERDFKKLEIMLEDFLLKLQKIDYYIEN